MLDCDVLQADGGTRTAAITGAYVALAEAIRFARENKMIARNAQPLVDTIAAVSVGIIDGVPMLDLPYVEDVRAETDMNVVVTGSGKFVEVQGTAEGAPFDRDELNKLLDLALLGTEPAGRHPARDPGRGSVSGDSAVSGAGAAPRLVLATHNDGKLRELRELLRGQIPGLDVDTQVVDAAAVGAPDVAETGVTFAENSLLKARAVAEATGLVAIADDSGLSVDVLGGAPGIFSARWAGRHGDDDANLRLLLAQLADVPDGHRGAAFVCAAALAVPASASATGPAKWWSTASWRAPCCVSRAAKAASATTPSWSPWAWTAAARSSAPEEKNAISHRGLAFRALLPSIVDALAAILSNAEVSCTRPMPVVPASGRVGDPALLEPGCQSRLRFALLLGLVLLDELLHRVGAEGRGLRAWRSCRGQLRCRSESPRAGR